MKFLSAKTHVIIGLIVGLALVVAPNLFGFNDNNGAAEYVPRVLGIFIIINELITKYGLIKLVPMRMHVVIDYLAGAFLALSPWLFGFADGPENQWVPHLIVGIVVVGYALVTNTGEDTTDRA